MLNRFAGIGISFAMALFASIVGRESFAGTCLLRNPPGGSEGEVTGGCGCHRKSSGIRATTGCVMIDIGMGTTTPWTGSEECSLRVFADDDSPMVFTPDSLYPIVGYTFKRLGNKVMADGVTPGEVVFTHPNGEPVAFIFEEGESFGRPDPRRHVPTDERLQMVDARGWATTHDPVYWDLYLGDGSVRRFLATPATGALGKLISETDARGATVTPEGMGIDIVRSVDGVRQFLTPSRLADVRVVPEGYDVVVYPVADPPVKNQDSGLYPIPQARPVYSLGVRRGADDREVVATVRNGESDPMRYVYTYTEGDWSFLRPDGVRESKVRRVDDSVSARIVREVRSAEASPVLREEMNYVYEPWGYAMTNKVEGFGSAVRTTAWSYVLGGDGKGKVRTRVDSSGLKADYTYDALGRVLTETLSGPGMMTETTSYSYASVDPSDVVPPVDTRPRTVVKTVNGIECERTYYVYSPLTNVVERAGVQGAPYGAVGALRTVTAFYPVAAGDVCSGLVRSVRREDGRLDCYEYSLVTNIWIETVSHFHEQATEPVSGKTTRDVSVRNRRGEILEQKTEAYIDGSWYTISRDLMTYDATGKRIRTEDLAGRATVTAWDCCRKVSETQPDGSTTTWDYDAEGNVIASSRLIPLDMTNVTWLTTCYSYDALGRQTATWQTNYAAQVGLPVTRTRYDALGRVIARTIPGRGTSRTSYSVDGLVVTNIAPNGATIITTRNSDGDTLSITGTGVTPEFMSRGVLADGTRWSRTVQGETADSPRFTKRYENMLGQTVRSEKSGFRGAILASVNTYDAYGRLVAAASDGEPTTTYAYDTFGNRIETTTRAASGEWRKSESRSAYALRASDILAVQTNVVSCSDATIPAVTQSRAERVTGLTSSLLSQSLTTDARGNVSESRVEYDGFETIGINISPAQTGRAESHARLGVEVRSVSATGVESRTCYDGLGRPVASIDGRGNASRTEYDSFGRQSTVIDADNNRTTYAYDALGQLVAVTNALGDAVVYAYDLRGHKTYEGGATYPVRYYYDVFGNKSSMTTYRAEGAQDGDTTTWRYDAASNCMTNKVYADGNGTKYEYDAHGRLTKRTWARGIDTTYTYNAWGSLTRTDYSDSTPSVVLCYDAMGRQTRAVDAAGVTTFAYDSFGSLTNETVVGVAGTNTIERFYDAFGRDAGYALNGVRQSTLGYDAATGRLVTMQAAGSDTPFTWSYLAGSDLKSSLAYPNGMTASWTYGNRGELIEVNNALADGSISKYAYTYDAAGRRVACAKSGTAFEQSDSVNYGYNVRSELTSATAAVDSDYRYGYNFDDIGNRRSSLECGVQSAEYEANRLNQYTNIIYSSVQPSTSNLQPTYDADGNQTLVKTATGIWQVTYNGENRPVRWTQGDTVITMSFDHMGRRVTKNNQRFVYNGYLQIANFHSTTTTSDYNYFVWDCTESVATRPLAWNFSTSQPSTSQLLFYTHDGNKNVSEVIASNNDVSAHYEYAPFGALAFSRGGSAAANPWRFSSEYAENDTATVYYNYRHYEPIRGRWLNRDPATDLESYLLCHNQKGMVEIDYIGLLKFNESCASIKETCQNDVAEIVKLLQQYVDTVKANKDVHGDDNPLNQARRVYEQYGASWPLPSWGDEYHVDSYLHKLEQIMNDLKNTKQEVLCCPKKKSLCKKEDASFWGRRTGLIDHTYYKKIVLCPNAVSNLSKWGGCGCLVFHELLHKYGFNLQLPTQWMTNEALKQKNLKIENGMIRLARLILGRACKGYNVWED